MEDHHAVVLYNKYIANPIFKYLLPRTMHYLKICEEINEDEAINNAIFMAICYNNEINIEINLFVHHLNLFYVYKVTVLLLLYIYLLFFVKTIQYER